MVEYGLQVLLYMCIVWLCNNDEFDLEQFELDECEVVMECFVFEFGMCIYCRGICCWLVFMLDGDIVWQVMVWVVLLLLGQVLVICYGEEIGFGDCLELLECNVVWMLMYWYGGLVVGFID